MDNMKTTKNTVKACIPIKMEIPTQVDGLSVKNKARALILMQILELE